jgi:hypothetical protein
MRFYLGTHEPTWLNHSHVPLFVSAVRLRERCKVKLPKARVPWALDSGGFSVLNKWGHYPTTNAEYAAEVRRWSERIGNMDWAAVQDWMCEPVVLAKTGLTVADHQRLTVESYAELKRLAPDLPWLPVLQGYTRDEYFRCLEMYERAGFDLRRTLSVGIGSVCRRQDTAEAEAIVRELAGLGLLVHGFGFKTEGVERCKDVLASADSLAWSDGARRDASRARRLARLHAGTPSLFGCETAAVKTKANDPAAALKWMGRVRVKAAITEDEGQTVCPYCGGLDVHPATSSDLDSCCVDCGESWGDVRETTLTHR